MKNRARTSEEVPCGKTEAYGKSGFGQVGFACLAGGKRGGLGARTAAGGKASGTVVLDEQASHFFSKSATKSATGHFSAFLEHAAC